MIVSLWVCVARHAESTKTKFTISLQYLKKNVKDKVDFFLAADKCQRFFQNDTFILGVWGQACPNYPK